jgi:hypothetical protein
MTQEEKDPFAHFKAAARSPYKNLKVLLRELLTEILDKVLERNGPQTGKAR